MFILNILIKYFHFLRNSMDVESHRTASKIEVFLLNARKLVFAAQKPANHFQSKKENTLKYRICF